MSAVRKDDTLPRDGLSHPLRTPLNLGYSPPFSTQLRGVGSCAARLRSHLLTLGLLRGIAAVVLLLAAATLDVVMDIRVPKAPLVVALVVLFALQTWLLARTKQPRPVSNLEFLSHLMFDVLWLAYVLYWLGGSEHNPFADLFILYVGMAALVLPWRYVALVCAVSFSAYGLLNEYHHDIAIVHGAAGHEELESLAHHTHFMLFGFILAYVGYRLAAMNRRFEELASLGREHDFKRESAVDLAALAAGTAHEMGTPLTTIAVLASDMRRRGMKPDEADENLRVISEAVQACKNSLSEIVKAIGADDLSERQRQTVVDFVSELTERFQPMRPGTAVNVRTQGAQSTMILVGAPLRQALMSLLVNAADVSADSVEVDVRCSASEAQIDVLDRGPGIPAEVRDKLGVEVVTSKPTLKGTGIGVYLANMTITRMGGRLDFIAREGGGTCARVTLPAAD